MTAENSSKSLFSWELTLSTILTLLLIVMDKLGKLDRITLAILFGAAALLGIHAAAMNSWIRLGNPGWQRIRHRAGSMSAVFLFFAAMGLWLFSGTASPSKQDVLPGPHIELVPTPAPSTQKPPEYTHEQPKEEVQKYTANTKTKDKGVTNVPAIQQSGENNIAQVGNNNQAAITVAPTTRRLSSDQKAKLVEELSPYRNISFDGIYTLAPGGEPQTYAQDFFQVFKAAGWDVGKIVGFRYGLTVENPDQPIPHGVWILINRDETKSPPAGAEAVVKAFKMVGIEPQAMAADVPAGKFEILIGPAQEPSH